jgi:hypothetical protein
MGDGAGYWRLAVRTPREHRALMAALDPVAARLLEARTADPL